MFLTKVATLLGVCEGHVTKRMCFFSRETPRNRPQARPATYFLLGSGPDHPDHPDHDHGGGVGWGGFSHGDPNECVWNKKMVSSVNEWAGELSA